MALTRLGTNAITTVSNSAITLDAAEIPNLDTAKITTGTMADARISSSSVVQHSAPTDLSGVNADITALALREATNESSAAFNLPNQFIETFTDDTNLGTQTTGDRTSGYWNTLVTGVGINSNTKLMLHMNDTSLIDSSGTSTSTTVTGGWTRSSTQSKFGGYSALCDDSGGDYITFSNIPAWGSSLWGIDFWVRFNGSLGASDYQSFFSGTTDSQWIGFRYDGASSGTLMIEVATAGGGWMSPGSHRGTKSDYVINQWYHIAISRTDSTTIKWWVDGVLDATRTTASGSISCTSDPRMGHWGGWDIPIDGYVDEYRMQVGESPQLTSGDPLYISSGTGFTPPSIAYAGASVNATGTLIQSANTVASAKTKVGGTMLYKDNAGTATLGTDLKIYFSCNNGGAWTEAASYNAITPVYSTGIKQVRLGETTCTSGTGVIYKAVWANQASGSKETQLHGIGVNY